MDQFTRNKLKDLIQSEEIAALGTIREGEPQVSMVLYTPAPDFSAFYLNISRLAFHTQDILQNPKISLMIAETKTEIRDPQMRGRITIHGIASEINKETEKYQAIKAHYLERYPLSDITFKLKDFSVFEIVPIRARYIAGFGEIHSITPEDLQKIIA